MIIVYHCWSSRWMYMTGMFMWNIDRTRRWRYFLLVRVMPIIVAGNMISTGWSTLMPVVILIIWRNCFQWYYSFYFFVILRLSVLCIIYYIAVLTKWLAFYIWLWLDDWSAVDILFRIWRRCILITINRVVLWLPVCILNVIIRTGVQFRWWWLGYVLIDWPGLIRWSRWGST